MTPFKDEFRRIIAPIAYSGSWLSGGGKVALSCFNQLKGPGWIVQLDRSSDPDNLVVIDALTGKAYQVTGELSTDDLEDISKEQLIKVDKHLKTLTGVTMRTFTIQSAMKGKP